MQQQKDAYIFFIRVRQKSPCNSDLVHVHMNMPLELLWWHLMAGLAINIGAHLAEYSSILCNYANGSHRQRHGELPLHRHVDTKCATHKIRESTDFKLDLSCQRSSLKSVDSQ